ncbi:MAG: TIGR01212 family radical SAM protein [Bacilli bacterium]|jgi:radical SAM protein (TIGR01212 family)|nr:TIGR01212 family radical SAM protein [Acholeplasmataceae bacterium]HOA79285.1 TIGR01212 family radical SAM protein [Bacilli bacterium]HPZ27950.1 TIGR01212 family radical SAM protein [Bacilli bacterium]HQC90291.1 TIGR01212 family radical SAM protein [Bacilli bacterium]
MKYFTPQHRYNTLDEYLKSRFGSKVFKVSLNAGFTCPNRDGAISRSGCFFCSQLGSGEFAGDPFEPIAAQFQKIKNKMHDKWPEGKYIVYFQANTNTYAPAERLKELFSEAVDLDPGIVALSIATRCDAIDDEILDYLASLNERIPVWLEIGLQSRSEETMRRLNLGYNLEAFLSAIRRIRTKGIETIVHIINGLPGEDAKMMVETARFLNSLDIQGVKIHSLYLVKGSVLGEEYLKKPFPLLDLAEYVEIVCEQLAVLKSDIIIHRVTGDPPRDLLIAPRWTLKKFVVMNEIDKRMRAKGLCQGCKYEKAFHGGNA